MKFAPKDYCYYSRLLKKEFDTLEELRAAEAAEVKKQEEKAKAAESKKNDAAAVEAAYKNLNAAKRRYKDDLNQITARYTEDLRVLKETFEADRQTVIKALGDAEAAYEHALKEFTDKYPEGFHITLKDGDYETTISSQTTKEPEKKPVVSLFDLFFPLSF